MKKLKRVVGFKPRCDLDNNGLVRELVEIILNISPNDESFVNILKLGFAFVTKGQ